MEKDSAVMQNTNYKLLDLMKFICAFFVIGIHTRPLQAFSDVADKLFYYDISNYAVPFFYACTGYFLIVRQQNKGVHECKLRSNGMPVPLLRNCYSIFNGTKYR